MKMNKNCYNHAENGREIVQKFAEAKPDQYDMILMDLQMLEEKVREYRRKN